MDRNADRLYERSLCDLENVNLHLVAREGVGKEIALVLDPKSVPYT